ncbi:FtsX-like permease family protein [Conexibacter sp. W3-3-2]|uniref:ABC transporter permease n=1 Tax=Conexibacter sp. W3-3-2 TaxID=2675227 RepID=UPI0012B932FB|nr:ABC transporter permease [Conexibacter sp. W3-3-2]MTD46021.1 FtsX-like permease family protein [Conexibacter sp. W3-3-2]
MTALLLGVRLALAGGRPSAVRAAMTAAGVALGVLVLLVAASIPTMVDGHDGREAARAVTPSPGPATATSTLVTAADTTFRDEDIGGLLVQAEGGRPATPPGVRRLPGPGDLVVSPALRDLLARPDAALLRERLRGRIVGTIGDAGLTGPGELFFYAGTDRLSAADGDRVTRFGGGVAPDPLPGFLTFLIAVAVVVLLLPIGAFIATAVRFGGEDRDRRLAALRLVGADRAMAARVATGETLVGALGGLLVGVGLFALARPLAGGIELFGVSVFPADVRPDATLAALVVLAIPLAAIVSSLAALRSVVIEPLGVVRRSATAPRRLGWRLLPAVIGAWMLWGMRGDLLRTDQEFDAHRAGVAVLLVLVGMTAVLPWVVEASVRRLGGGGLPWQLAVRRIQMDGGTAARVVSGVAVAVAGAIALQTLFTAAERVSTLPNPQSSARANVAIYPVYPGDAAMPQRSVAALRAIPGLQEVSSVRLAPAQRVGADEGAEIIVGDCDSLRAYGRIGRCRDGDTFLTGRTAAAPARTFELGGEGAAPSRWRIPAGARRVEPAPGPTGGALTGILATPRALAGIRLPGAEEEVYATVAPGVGGDTIERMRNVVADGALRSDVFRTDDPIELGAFTSVRRAIFAGTALVLLLLGASLLVGGLEQLRERRRPLAVLAAFGTRRRVLAWSVLLQAAVPVTLGLAVAVGTGIGLGWMLLRVGGASFVMDWGAVAGMTGIGAAVVLLVTALTLPALLRLTAPSGLRTE